MKVMIIGGAGMVGRKLAARIAGEGLPTGAVSSLILHDIFPPAAPAGAGFPVDCQTGNAAAPDEAARLAALRPDVVYHLAAIVSGEAEMDFDKGWEVNARGLERFLFALRAEHAASGGTYRPRVIFTSSIAVFGAPFPELIGDEFLTAPQTSYGAQKACCELMLNDFSRKGFVDGIAIRLPTICVRPGKPNAAASGFFSGIIREPLNGQEAQLPVPASVVHTHASPRSAARFLTHAAGIAEDALQGRRALNMPGVGVSVEEQIEALRAVAGQKAVDLIRPAPDEAIMAIVKNWPTRFDPARARALGFEAETSFEEIIRVYLEDDFQGA
ncbi:D-erythronate dehydrogenase [Rhodovulum sp. DZ06]|uniref:D-erythronate dehydrogenase n=1 Tax=Rhodovulum sp. DZ06 TaxID=3425126 RepID=UPI003D346F15